MGDAAWYGIGLTAILAGATALVRAGRVEQRILVAEAKNVEQDKRLEERQTAAAAHDTAIALANQRIASVDASLVALRSDLGSAQQKLSAIELEQIAHRGDLRLVVEGLGRLEETVLRGERTTQSMLERALEALTGKPVAKS